MRYPAIVLILASSACGQVMDAVEATTCGDDPECLITTYSPEQIEAALEFVGPCYEFADRLCAKVEFCTGALRTVQECRSWMLQTVCAAADFTPDKMRGCGLWSDAVECDYFFDPTYYPIHQSCVDLFPHPLAPEAFDEPIPAAVR